MASRIAATPRAPGGRPSGGAVAIAVSAAAHAGLFALFAWRLGEAPVTAEPPVMIVELLPWPVRRPPEEAPRPRPREPGLGDRERRELVVRPSLPRPPGVDAPAPAPFATGEAQAGPVLRGLVDCRPSTLDRLSAEARERCDQRLAGDPALRPAAAAARLNLDAAGRFAQDDEPYLARKPKKGCKVRAAGAADPMGKQGPAAGIACAWAF